MATSRRSSSQAASRSGNGLRQRTEEELLRIAAWSRSCCERATSPLGHSRTAPSAKYVSVPSGIQAGAVPANASPSGPSSSRHLDRPVGRLEESAVERAPARSPAGAGPGDPPPVRREDEAALVPVGRVGGRPVLQQRDRPELAGLVGEVERPAELAGEGRRLVRIVRRRRRAASAAARARRSARSRRAARRSSRRARSPRRRARRASFLPAACNEDSS